MKPHELIKLLADQSKLSTLQLAKNMHRATFQGTLHKVLAGDVKSPTHSTAKYITDYFDLPIEAMYDGALARRIAIDRGLIYDKSPVADAPLAAMEVTTAPTPIKRRRGGLATGLIARIELLTPKQLRSLEQMVAAYLDAVAPEAESSKRAQAQ